MKTVKTTLSKVMIAIATIFFFGLAASSSGSAHAQTSEVRTTTCGVSNEEVIKYLNDYGYSVSALRSIDGSCDKIARTATCEVRVYISDSRIIDHEEANI